MPKCMKEGCKTIVLRGYCMDHAMSNEEPFESQVLKRLDRIAVALEALGRK